MKLLEITITALFSLFVAHGLDAQLPVLETGAQKPMPPEWIDKDTGHRVKRLADREGPNRSFYFHNNPFIAAPGGKGELMVFYGSTDKGMQLFTVNLQTLEVNQLTDSPGRKSGEIVAVKRREVFYQVQDSVFATKVDDSSTRLVYVFPDDFKAGITTLNADERQLAGTWAGPEKRAIYEKYPAKGDYFNRIFEAKIPHTLFTVDVETGELKKIHSENTWLGHIQFSPTDPALLMFCHEGPWHEVDRIWNIDISTGEVKKVHERTVYREIAGHEFWSPDGSTIWYDLQVPRGETFYLAGYNVKNGKKTRYQMDRNEWSIHFNISPDQRLFCGDGGDPTQVAKAEDGMWIYLFRPRKGRFRSEKLVNMKHHGYRPLEPNVHFTPDGKWIVFRADFEGESQVYAVEIQKSK
ncbi:MAG: hypothetical protein H6564_09185 [Lewinellaceae bacterium]|nr:hypothetical protein [Lewinellaceae bacterium]